MHGQSLVEFALILPIMLTLFGAAVDLSRMYSTWIKLQSATRAAAEYTATNDQTSATAQADATTLVCTQVTGSASCSAPTVTVSNFSLNTSPSVGGSNVHPVGSSTVQTSMPFRTLFPYPLFSQNGVWTLAASGSYSVVQGRQ
jgi:Flp pilus assembly protein TadG